jgi:hypothetical protein
MVMSKVLFSFLVFGIISVSACKSESEKSGNGDYHMAALHEILAAYNAEKPDWDRAEKTEGPVKILVEKDMVYIEHDGYNSVEIVTYFLQTEKKVRGLKSGSIEIAEVLFMESNLIVNSIKDNRTLHFALNHAAHPGYLPALKEAKTYTGFGLGFRKVNKGSFPENVSSCQCEKAGNFDSLCPSGGSMFLDCRSANEYGACRVTCSGQTFACCGNSGK